MCGRRTKGCPHWLRRGQLKRSNICFAARVPAAKGERSTQPEKGRSRSERDISLGSTESLAKNRSCASAIHLAFATSNVAERILSTCCRSSWDFSFGPLSAVSARLACVTVAHISARTALCVTQGDTQTNITPAEPWIPPNVRGMPDPRRFRAVRQHSSLRPTAFTRGRSEKRELFVLSHEVVTETARHCCTY